MFIEILFVMTMFLWLLVVLPLAPLAPFAPHRGLLAWIAVLLLGLSVYAGSVLH